MRSLIALLKFPPWNEATFFRLPDKRGIREIRCDLAAQPGNWISTSRRSLSDDDRTVMKTDIKQPPIERVNEWKTRNKKGEKIYRIGINYGSFNHAVFLVKFFLFFLFSFLPVPVADFTLLSGVEGQHHQPWMVMLRKNALWTVKLCQTEPEEIKIFAARGINRKQFYPLRTLQIAADNFKAKLKFEYILQKGTSIAELTLK